MRAVVIALALAGAGCQETLAPPDFAEVRPQCPSAPMAGASCDPISEPSCTYPTEQMVCTCEDNDLFVCIVPRDLGLAD